jgi:serine/threonine-protein kinase
MYARVFATVVGLAVAAVVFWYALVHTVHRGTLALPDLRGESLEQAERIAHDLGIAVSLEEPGVFSAATPSGSIAVQEPPPGFHVKVGSSVTVRLSLGSERVAVPNVIGESLQGAVRGLEQLGLTAGRRLEVDGETGGDRILATQPGVGTEVPPATAVDLLVNVAPSRELWVMPSLLSQHREVVRRFCRDHQLRLGQIHEVAYPGIASGLVLRQYPPAGAPLSRGDIIAMWVSQ